MPLLPSSNNEVSDRIDCELRDSVFAKFLIARCGCMAALSGVSRVKALAKRAKLKRKIAGDVDELPPLRAADSGRSGGGSVRTSSVPPLRAATVANVDGHVTNRKIARSVRKYCPWVSTDSDSRFLDNDRCYREMLGLNILR